MRYETGKIYYNRERVRSRVNEQAELGTHIPPGFRTKEVRPCRVLLLYLWTDPSLYSSAKDPPVEQLKGVSPIQMFFYRPSPFRRKYLASTCKRNREFMAFTIRWFVNFEGFRGARFYRAVPTNNSPHMLFQ